MTKKPIDMNKYSESELLETLEHLKRDSCDLLQWNDRNNQAYNQIVSLIKKPEVTEEWIEKKAFRLFARLLNINGAFLEAEGMRSAIKDFIHSLMEDIHG